MEVPSSFTVQDIKREIQYEAGIPVAEQYLTFNQKPFKATETINKLGLKNGAFI